MKLKVGLVGLGYIAAMYAEPSTPNPYCHSGGIRLSSRVELVAAADLSAEARERFLSVWGGEFTALSIYASQREMLAAEQLDIISICVRGPHHYTAVMEAIDASPKAIFLEKPPTCSLEEMDDILRAAKAKHIAITVSYSRHWHPSVLRMQQLAQDGIIGDVHTVIGYCGGHMLSFASHTTDLICQFAGYRPLAVRAQGKVQGDSPQGYEVEPELDHMTIRFESGAVGLQVGGLGEHGNFYCDVYGTKGRLRTGMYIPPALFDSNGKPVDLTGYDLPPEESVFTVAYDQIADYVAGGALPHCTNEHFVAVHEIGFAAIESILSGQEVTLPVLNRSRKVFANG